MAIASHGIAVSGLWVVSFAMPALLSRDDLVPLYVTALFSSLVAALVAVAWRWRAGRSWHANGALAVSLATQVFNCCGFFYCIGKAAGSVG